MSKENMDQGRESPPSPNDGQQTTLGESATESSSSDLSEDQNNSVETVSNQEEICENAVEISDTQLDADFRECVEVFFTWAERTIVKYGFHLAFAKDWVLQVRDVGFRYMTKGCKETKLEDIVINRALTTVDHLVDGVQTDNKEVYDPRQTVVYLYCAMAVFPSTVQLKTSNADVRNHLSSGGSACLSQLATLDTYCAIKTEWEEMEGCQNTLSHLRILLGLAEWLEVDDRAPVTFLITSKTVPLIDILTSRFVQVDRFRVQYLRLWDIGMVLTVSSLVRENLMKGAKPFYKLLMRVDTAQLPRTLATRYFYAYARLLQNCREFAKALECAEDALSGVTDMEERREIDALMEELREAIDNAVYDRDLRGPPDEEWLKGTHAQDSQARTDPRDAIRQRHAMMEARRKKIKTVPVPRRRQTPSPASFRDRQPQRLSPFSSRNTEDSSFSLTQSPTSCHSVCNTSPGGSFYYTPEQESILDSSSSDEGDEEEDDEYDDREIRFVDSPDEDDEDDTSDQDISANDRMQAVTAQKMEDEEDDQQDWYEKSEKSVANSEVDEDAEDAIELSDGQNEGFKKGGKGRGFYSDFHPNPEQLLTEDPKRYKRCQLKIERAHKAIAKVLDKDSKYSEILIEGRSKAGRTYMDDEVVVEILAEPGEFSGLQKPRGASATPEEQFSEKMAHGKVVGLLKRVNFEHVEHPVLFCTLDEVEGHLMKPLCKTVPKIHVMNDNVRLNYPALVKNRIEIKAISSEGEVQFRGYCNVQPDKREQYIFRVVILSWRQGNIYPLGAVLGAYVSGRDYSGGLRVLSMQQRVPKFYPRAAVEETKQLVQETAVTKTGRRDLTGERLFTIDPPGSKDLDDAISIRREGPHVIIGVHIADVAAVVKKDSGLDLEARRRAVTFYPDKVKPHCMLPEPLSHGKCSLLPDKERYAFSVFFKFNKNGKQVEEPDVSRTVIKSKQQLTYEQAQKVIDGHAEVNVQPSIQEDIHHIHKITSKLRETRLKQSMLFVPFEDPRLSALEKTNEFMAAHSLIEELMILTNAYIASRLNKRPRFCDSMIVRCHKAPTFEKLAEWQEKEGHVTNLVMQLQGKWISPNRQLSVTNSTPRGYSSQPPIVVQRQIWQKLCQHLEQGEVEEARKLAFMDALHPLQCLATNSWMDLMETAEYKCAYGLNRPDLLHFGLSLDVYTHFTSPIRRYADLHVQRLLHADLNGRSPECGPDEVTELCQHINCATFRQKAFGKGCMALRVADSLQRQPLVFRAYIDKVDAEQLTLFLPSLQKVSDRKQKLPFSMLGVSTQPEVITDTVQKKDIVTVQWNRRFYDETGKCSGTLRSMWKYLENSGNIPSAPVIMQISPDQLSETVRQKDWLEILKTLASSEQRCQDTTPQPINREKSEVEYMSSEKGDGTVSVVPVHFKRVYTRGQIIEVQMSAEPKKGILKPRVDILRTAQNASVCTQHVSEPVMTLSRTATRPTRDQQFSNYKQYIKAWMPLLEMEAAVGAGDSDGSVVIDNVPVTIRTQTSSNSLLYKGSFTLPATFCYDRCIKFGGESVESIREEEYKSDNFFPLDYLCLRYKTECSSAVMTQIMESEVPDAVDKHYTWLAHASVVQVLHKNHKAEDGGHLTVVFVLSPSSPQPPPQLMTGSGGRITLEILPKSDVDRHSQKMLLQLKNPDCELAQAIAFGSRIPKLDSDHRRLGRKDENHEVNIDKGVATKHLIRNNRGQRAAIELAMTNSMAIIQGPPGTGKTNTGIKLVYLYCKINRQLQAEGKGKKTVLYCGPSNKSVDLVARELKSNLGSACPKIVRMYGSTIESKDYPVPVGDIRSTRGMRDLKSDPELQDVTLHHLIREQGKPYAEGIAVFEKHFEGCRKEPKVYSVTKHQLKRYRKLVYKASVEELKHYDVVLCTCAVGGNSKLIEGTEGSIFQVIIDECAMSPEPQSMIPIVATKAQQVVLIGDHKQLRPIIRCQPAAELGLDQSLFERLFHKFPSYSTFLNRQYRMNPEICAFPAKEFYDSKLWTGSSILWTGGLILKIWPRYPPGTDAQVPHLFVDVRGEEEMLTVTTDQGNERSKSNVKEAEKVIEILTFLKKRRVDIRNVKLLTQYNAQRHLLEEKLKTAMRQNVEHVFDHFDLGRINISTVVSSQGGEWDYVILSTVRSLPSYKIEPYPTLGWCRQNMGFITDRNQVNVALTRARKGLIIVGNAELLKCDKVWEHLIRRYTARGCFIEDPSLFPPKDARRSIQKRRQPNASSEWQEAPRRRTSPPDEVD